MSAVKVRLHKLVDTQWRWSFLGPKPRKDYFGHIEPHRFIIRNTSRIMTMPTIRLIGEWKEDSLKELRVRFSWNSPWFLGFSGLILLIVVVATIFYMRFGVGVELLKLCGFFGGLLCLLTFVPLLFEYRAALKLLQEDLGLRMAHG